MRDHDFELPFMIQAVLETHLSKYKRIDDVEAYVNLVWSGCEMHTLALKNAIYVLIFRAVDDKPCSHLDILLAQQPQLQHKDVGSWEHVSRCMCGHATFMSAAYAMGFTFRGIHLLTH